MFFIKLSYIGVILLPILIIVIFYRKNLFQFLISSLNFFLLILFILWLIKNFLLSGCFIFPLNFTCMNVSWSPGVDEIETYKNVVKSFARDTRERLLYNDLNHTIYTFNWFLPWLKDYALNTAFLKISFILIFFTSLIFLFLKRYTKILNIVLINYKIHALILLVLTINLLIWFQAPEIRFGWGTIINLNCYLVSILFFYNIFFNKIHPNIPKYLTMFFHFILFFDNKNNLTTYNLFNPYITKPNYSKIVKIYDLEGISIYRSMNWKCYDFKEICVNTEREDYFLNKKFEYLIFKKN